MTSIKAVRLPSGEINRPFLPERFVGRGFTFAGSTIVDVCYRVAASPAPDTLVLVEGQKVLSTGGLVCNNAVPMRKLGLNIPVQAIGALGADNDLKFDSEGAMIAGQLQKYGVDIRGLVPMAGRDTSFTQIPTNAQGIKHFMHSYGACADFNLGTFPMELMLENSIALIGYMNLLPSLMADGGAGAADLLRAIKNQTGSYVGIDFTDIYGEGFDRLFASAADEADFIVTNEMSVAQGTGIDVKEGDVVNCENLLLATQTVIDRHPNLQWIAVHWPLGGLFYRNDHKALAYPVQQLHEGDFIGSTGAGDNWTVGFLASAYLGKDPLFALHLATTAAAKSLGALSGSDASGSLTELMEFSRTRSLLKIDPALEGLYPKTEPVNWGY